MSSSAARKATALDTQQPPLDTAQLRGALKRFLDQKIPAHGRLGSCQHGLYAFFDYDGEPIYVGQTIEQLGTRVRRHLTNQRTDAVAMGVLDPFEVRTVKVWPIWPEELAGLGNADIRIHLDGFEASLFEKLLAESRFHALLNEKPAPVRRGKKKELPTAFSADLVGDDIAALREHPDIRLARRATAIAKLAQIISERKVSRQLRRVLVAQAKRLTWLAEERAKVFANAPDDQDTS
jgi:hypothetical protein